MKLAKVVGNIVSTIKADVHENEKLLVVKICDEKGNIVGEEKIAIDKADAGKGDYVLLLDDGGASRIIIGQGEVPVDSIIVGVVDDLSLDLAEFNN
ncbi:MAG: EutN/CcmL family microcompartment protein [Bacillota bacterium]